jgi:MOSC domain-containing protein YiiM
VITLLMALLLYLGAVEPCETEDASFGCTWYASVQGNGEGYTFTVLHNGTLIYW